ncbi:MAG TPA: hypothetical protein PKD32_11905 [Saprospiraceae bacterium]|nr:hypothetical protein [Saprospiraceae bacterium]
MSTKPTLLFQNELPMPIVTTIQRNKKCSDDMPDKASMDQKRIENIDSQTLMNLKQKWRSPNYHVEPLEIIYSEKQMSTSQLTDILQLCLYYRHPVILEVKSMISTSIIDCISALQLKKLIAVRIQICSLKETTRKMISKEMLPVQAVLKMIYSLSTKGIPVIAVIGPIIHQINDFELEPLVKHVADLGVKKITYYVNQNFDSFESTNQNELIYLHHCAKSSNIIFPLQISTQQWEIQISEIFQEALTKYHHLTLLKLNLNDFPGLTKKSLLFKD